MTYREMTGEKVGKVLENQGGEVRGNDERESKGREGELRGLRVSEENSGRGRGKISESRGSKRK